MMRKESILILKFVFFFIRGLMKKLNELKDSYKTIERTTPLEVRTAWFSSLDQSKKTMRHYVSINIRTVCPPHLLPYCCILIVYVRKLFRNKTVDFIQLLKVCTNLGPLRHGYIPSYVSAIGFDQFSHCGKEWILNWCTGMYR